MKKIILSFILLVSIKVFGNSNMEYTSQRTFPDTSIVPQILILPLSNYIGKPVDSLFSVLPSGYVSRTFIPSSRIGYTRGVSQNYNFSSGSCFVEIFIDTFNYLTIPNYSAFQNWNMQLAKQETIAFIKVWNNNICVYECNNIRY